MTALKEFDTLQMDQVAGGLSLPKPPDVGIWPIWPEQPIKPPFPFPRTFPSPSPDVPTPDVITLPLR